MNKLLFVSLIAGATCAFSGELELPDQQTPWTTSRIVGSPHPPAPYRVTRAFAHLEFKNPVEVMAEPGADRFWCVEVDGGVYRFDNRADARPELIANLKAVHPEIRRVFGFQFHPRFEENGFVYFCYAMKPGEPEGSRLSRFRVRDTNPPSLDVASERVIITWRSGGHNGCAIHFGPDGYLYFSTGDSEVPSPPDPLNTGQDLSDLLGAIIRIDVDRAAAGRNYAIPPDNPFIDTPNARPEIWAYGLRNPWRMSFTEAGELLVGDVGWELWEMVYRVVKGGNYGWSITEGPQPVKPNQPVGPTPIRKPLVSHSHVEAMSITGGYTWNAERLPELRGRWLYGDYVTGKIWALRTKGDEVVEQRELLDSSIRVICFAKAHSGEVFVVDYEGLIYRLETNDSTPDAKGFPRRLSETGLFSDTANQTPAVGVLPYEISMEPWMDGATARRFVGLPGDGRLAYHKANNPAYGRIRDFYAFPTNAVLARTVALRGRKLETQVLHFDGEDWHPYNYLWNEAQTDAALADGKGGTIELEGAEWRVHNDTECMTCHMPRSGFTLGFHPQFTDVVTTINGRRQRQQAAWQERGVIPGFSKFNQRWRPEESELQRAARNWLHVNCAHCHRQGGGGSAPFELRADVPPDRLKLFDVKPNQGTFGLEDPDIVRRGDPLRSVLLYRIAATGGAHMPRLGAKTVDAKGVRLVRDWITELGSHAAPGGAPDTFLYATDLSDTAKSLRLAMDLEPSRAGEVIADLAAHVGSMSPAVYDLFARHLPEAARRRTLGEQFDVAAILKLTGDPRSGEKLFFENPALQCANCHQLQGKGRNVGADLAQIASRYSREQILEAIVEPSKFIDPKFAAVSIDTREGDSYSGFIVARDASQVVLRDLTGVDRVLKSISIETFQRGQLSLMPTGLLAGLTAQEAADLLAFLQTLR